MPAGAADASSGHSWSESPGVTRTSTGSTAGGGSVPCRTSAVGASARCPLIPTDAIKERGT